MARRRAKITYGRAWVTFVVAALSGVAVVLLHWAEPRFLTPIEQYNYDILIQQRGEVPVIDDRLVLLGLDNGDTDFFNGLRDLYFSDNQDDRDELAEMFGGRTLPAELMARDSSTQTELLRLVHGRFMEVCAEMGVAAVVWDVAFDSPRSPDIDAIFMNGLRGVPSFLAVEGRVVQEKGDASASGRSGRAVEVRALVERYRVGSPTDVADLWPVPYFRVGELRPHAPIMASATGGGHVAYTLESDGVMRRTPVLTNANNRLFPSLPFAAALRALDPQGSGATAERIQRDGRSIVIPLEEGERRIPLDEEGRMLINFFPDWFERAEVRSYYKVWEDVAAWPEDFAATYRGKVLVIGETASYTNDLVTTPLDYDLPGVMALTSAMNTIVTGAFISPTPRWVVSGLTVLIGLVLGGVFLVRSLWLSVVVTAAVGVSLVVASPALFWSSNAIFFPVALPLITTLIAATAATLAALSRAYRWATRLSTVLSRLVSPALLEELYKHGITRRSLAPVRAEITVLFVDIAGFTSLSEVVEPEELSEFLTVWYEEAMAVLVENHGTLDKFLGDGVLAYFGAPEPLEDKVAWAARAAIGLQERFDAISDRLSKSRKTLRIRAGLCTGYATVGYLGGDRFAAYTILGRAVNMAARLEQNCVPGQVTIEKKTWAHLEGRFVMEPLEPIVAKGIDRPIEAWRLVREMTPDERLGETADSDSASV
ncbi:adenylate/guanylate cyclase domain-containing protein [Mucisphaera calidilacus]|uniref:Adenylate cyclase 1 n=1 Tax=Mucisphaera calidilacus TaxID=2527982 RepID=A0A518BUZ0_9BACT|nr:adenylate/guanylate cyclase domain-containing protein [Mucisphaera calidilacus]QDU70786.1 Adenylate cyclase 1 [Mucisphaera calidilacus]